MNRLITIGRDNTNDIVIEGKYLDTVGREHGQIFVSEDGGVEYIDLNSTNGSFINGERVLSPTKLKDFDILMVGKEPVPWMTYLKEINNSSKNNHTILETQNTQKETINHDINQQNSSVNYKKVSIVVIIIITILLILNYIRI